MHRQGDNETRAHAGRTFRSDAPPVPLYNSFTHRQTDAGSFVLTRPVQPLKEPKNFLRGTLGKTDPIVLHRNLAELPMLLTQGQDHTLTRNQNPRRYFRSPVFKGVDDKILKELPDLERIRLDPAQRSDLNLALVFLDHQFEIAQNLLDDLREINLLERLGLGETRE